MRCPRVAGKIFWSWTLIDSFKKAGDGFDTELQIMLSIETFIDIQAPPELLMAIYLDYERWPQLFPATIKGVRLVGIELQQLVVEVDHLYEGKVLNILTLSDNSQITLEEFKPRYNAIFINRFHECCENRTRYQIKAIIKLKGLYTLASLFIRRLVLKRIGEYVLLPMKNYAEGRLHHETYPNKKAGSFSGA